MEGNAEKNEQTFCKFAVNFCFYMRNATSYQNGGYGRI